MNESPQFPRLLGRYELVHLLGQGGMGEVYLAKISGAAGFEKPCIVKTILPALLKDRQFLDRFHHEAKVLVHLVHSSIAQVYDMGETEGTYYMALEYVAGVDLAFLLEQARTVGQQLPVPVALYLGQRIAEGLGYAHRKAGPDGVALGIVHRDVSPHNVMVSYEGEVKVIDFGLAKSAARSKYTLPSTVMGKLGYMSPEQVRAEAVDHRSDIYSCGVVVWELLAGRPLIAHGTVGEMMAAMTSPTVPALHELRADVDPALDAVVRRALAPAPGERYARADDFARALNEQFLRTATPFGAEEVGEFVRSLCPEAFAAQRKLISRISSSPGVRRTPLPDGTLVPLSTGAPLNTARLSPLPLTPSPAAPGFEPGPAPAASDPGYEATMVRPSSTATPAVGAAPGALAHEETLRLEKPVSAPGRKGWTAALILGALGLVGATAGVTTVLMNRRPPAPLEWEFRDGHPPEGLAPDGRPFPPPHHMPPPPDMPQGGRDTDEARLPPGGEQAMMAEAPKPPEPGMAPAGVPAPPDESAEHKSTSTATSTSTAVEPPSKPKPAEAHSHASKLVPAENVAVMMKPPRGDFYLVHRGRQDGLTEGMVLQVVAAPVKDGKAKLLGEATVVEVLRRRSAAVLPDARVRSAGDVERFLVLPRSAERAGDEPDEDEASAPPSAESDSSEKPAEPRELSGRVRFESIGPFARKVELTNTDTFIWSECTLVKEGRDVYKLGGMAPGGTREIPLGDFQRGGRDVPFVGKNRLGLFCKEGQKEFPVRMM